MVTKTDGMQDSDGEINLHLDKLKGYGLKSLSPLIELLHKYQNQVIPYADSIEKVLRAGKDSLVGDSETDADKVIFNWLDQGLVNIQEMRTQLQGKNISEWKTYLRDLSLKHPGLVFSASYLSGFLLGKVGRDLRTTQIQGDDYGTRH